MLRLSSACTSYLCRGAGRKVAAMLAVVVFAGNTHTSRDPADVMPACPQHSEVHTKNWGTKNGKIWYPAQILIAMPPPALGVYFFCCISGLHIPFCCSRLVKLIQSAAYLLSNKGTLHKRVSASHRVGLDCFTT